MTWTWGQYLCLLAAAGLGAFLGYWWGFDRGCETGWRAYEREDVRAILREPWAGDGDDHR